MANLRLRRIEGAGVRTLDAPFAVDLPERGVVHVRGASGAGKSTLLSVIGFALGYGPPATRLQSWHGTRLRGAVVLGDGDHEVVVARGAKLAVRVDGVAVEGNAEALEAVVQRELGVPLEILDRLAWRRQRTRSAFLTLPDEKKKAFLAGTAGIEAHEQRIKTGKRSVTEAEQVHVRAVARHQSLEQAIATLGPAPDAVAAREREERAREASGAAVLAEAEAHGHHLLVIAAWEGARALRRERAAEIVHEAVQRRAVATVLPTADPVAERTAVVEHQHDLRTCRAALQAAQREEDERLLVWRVARDVAREAERAGHAARGAMPRLTARIDELEHEIAHLEGQACPTCRRPWAEVTTGTLADARGRLRQAQGELAEATRLASVGEHALAAWEAQHLWMPASLDVLRQAEGMLQQRLGAAQAALATAIRDGSRERDLAVAAAEGALTQARRDAEQIEREGLPPDVVEAGVLLERARAATRAAAEAQRQAGRDHAALRAERGRRDALELQRTTAHGEVLAARLAWDEQADTLEAVRAFVGRYFDEMLLRVADETNQMLADVPNVRHCSISFRSEVTNKDGEVTRNAIIPVLAVGGHEIVGSALEGASGGMLSAIELAVDLAVRRVQERELGVRVGWLVIDEAFEGLPAASREACFEILRQEAATRLVLVVDHASEVGGLADHVIDVMIGDDGRGRVSACA